MRGNLQEGPYRQGGIDVGAGASLRSGGAAGHRSKIIFGWFNAVCISRWGRPGYSSGCTDMVESTKKLAHPAAAPVQRAITRKFAEDGSTLYS
jgi:hypothetical protein